MAGGQRFDVVIIGSGLGGSAALHVLADSGLSILVLERGGYVRQERENWEIGEVVLRRRYNAADTWIDGEGKPFNPRAYYNVGGATKFYGGSALRFREDDFKARQLAGGSTVAWPFGYGELAPWYDRAEALLEVHGLAGEDPSEPTRPAFPFPPLEHEDRIAELAEAFHAQGLHPVHLPIAVDQGPRGRCIKGSPCDGFPCKVRAKGDAENRLLRPLLLKKPANIELWTEARAQRLVTDASGRRVIAVLVERHGESLRVEGGHFILSAGAVNSAALLLASSGPGHEGGLANSSGLVGRNFMCHNNTVVLALSPLRTNPTKFQKTLAIHDFYGDASAGKAALGAIQMRGKIRPEMLRGKQSPLLRLFASAIAERSIDFWVMSEDLADPENRVTLDGEGRIHLSLKPTNRPSHEALLKRLQKALHRAGLPIVIFDRRGIDAIQHQCGTLRFGNDPARSVLDQWCKAHDLDNLYAIDAGFMPSSAAVNPSLTLLAQALRAAERLKGELTTESAAFHLVR
ncbi:MAG: GMC family oxidoreductase [Spirochaetota bacterium]